MQRHRLEVLYSGGEMEPVAGAGETAKAHPLEAMLDLQVRKTHIDLLRALLDRSNSGVPLSERAWLRASALMSRAIFLNGARVHRCLSVQARQS